MPPQASVAGSGIDEVALARRAAGMRSSQAAGRVQAFTARLAAVRERGANAAAVAAAAERMLAELNVAAERETSRLTTKLGRQTGDLLRGELALTPPAEIERRGRERLVQLTRDAAEAWRQSQRERLEDGLARLERRLVGRRYSGGTDRLAGALETAAALREQTAGEAGGCANSGGKSTFLRSAGLARLMMQCGMFVTARSLRASVCQGIFTHFIREEDPAMVSGRLDEELARMNTIADQISPHCLILFNESFAATNEREGSEIGTVAEPLKPQSGARSPDPR